MRCTDFPPLLIPVPPPIYTIHVRKYPSGQWFREWKNVTPFAHRNNTQCKFTVFVLPMKDVWIKTPCKKEAILRLINCLKNWRVFTQTNLLLNVRSNGFYFTLEGGAFCKRWNEKLKLIINCNGTQKQRSLSLVEEQSRNGGCCFVSFCSFLHLLWDWKRKSLKNQFTAVVFAKWNTISQKYLKAFYENEQPTTRNKGIHLVIKARSETKLLYQFLPDPRGT